MKDTPAGGDFRHFHWTMTPFITQLREKAAREAKTIVLPEAVDERILRAAAFLDEQKICRVILVSSEGRAHALADSFGIRLPESVLFSEPGTGENVEKFIQQLYERRRDRGMTEDMAAELVRQPLYWAASLVAQGEADGSVAGAMNTTADVLRAALQVVGLQQGSEVVSSVFMMSWKDGRVFTYGDCAVVPYPTAPQLASIAIDSAQTHQDLTGEEARVALLSFSTKGSAKHERIELVQEALDTVKRKRSLLAVDGELQFDAAFVEHIGQGKAPESPVAGKANVFIFPNLDAGNISYKITERLGGATATGPIIQGFAKPMNDVSRGCKWEDVVDTAAVCALMSESAED